MVPYSCTIPKSVMTAESAGSSVYLNIACAFRISLLSSEYLF